jgi:ribonuclease P protein component
MGKFRKSERLCSRKSIGKLFSSGNSLYHYPFRLVWLEPENAGPFPARLAISVPARRIRKAATRNRIKRLIRESYRTNKTALYEYLDLQNKKTDIMLIYISGTVYDYDFINIRLTEFIRKLIQENAIGKNIF